jgi:hypothetical protein
LPGIGYVILNQQKPHKSTTSAGMTVIGIHLVVTTTSPQAKAGTQAFVSVANSALSGPVKGVLSGLAFGTSANIGNAVVAGRSFPQYMPCLGTEGTTIKNTGFGAAVPGALSAGTIIDKANGTASSAQASGEMTSTIQHVNLFAGAVRASAVKADVTANGNPPARGDNSSFTGLHVSGHPGIKDNVPVNTQVNLPGIGTLWLHRQIKTPTGIRVIMIQLVIGSPTNPAGLPVGATVDVGYARVGVS